MASSGSGADSHVEVALPLPLFRTFTYRVDGPLPPHGTRVRVPFQRGERIGWVLGPGDPSGIRGIRPVLDVLERVPSVPAALMALARWMASYYVTPLGVVLRSMVPSVLSDASRDHLTLTPAGQAAQAAGAEESTSRARELLAALAGRGGTATVASLRRELGKGSPWNAVRELTSQGLVEHEMEPPRGPTLKIRKVVRVRHPAPDLTARETLFRRASRQRECFELLETAEGARELALLTGEDGFSRSVVTGLEEKGLVAVEEEELLRDPFQGREAPGSPAKFKLIPAQAVAVASLVAGLDQKTPAPFLLHGITGSGKTLVYIHLLKEVVEKRNRTAIVLVPEIALTPQTVGRFRAWFGEKVAVLHSALSDGERYDEWRQLRSGEKRIVVGARSALFAPLPDLGAIVVDEEHDGSYKQSEAPRYQARDLAVLRSHREGAVCVLGSATPSLESWRNAESGKFTLLSLPERATGASLPTVEVVDLRTLRKGEGGAQRGASNGSAGGSVGGPAGRAGGGTGRADTILSPRLVEAVQTRLELGQQGILLLNRRGYASFVQCRGCGEVMECPHCSVSLTFHRGRKRLLCHHCRHEEPAPQRCPRCGDTDLSYRGMGTEQVERIVFETFPTARIARMDVDTTGGKWAHAEILGRVERREVDLLLGTQMIAKGLDFPNVTLVGVINADVGLHLPDFRASERTFQLLSQVAGRAGRGALGGEVIVQTSVPEHYAIQAALHHDYEGFAARELKERTEPWYPPHLRLANVVVSSPDPELAAAGAEKAVAWIRQHLPGGGRPAGRELAGPARNRPAGREPAGSEEEPTRGTVEVVGPAPCPIERLHGRWRWHFFLRTPSPAALGRLLDLLVREHTPDPGDVRIAVDRDPVALL